MHDDFDLDVHHGHGEEQPAPWGAWNPDQMVLTSVGIDIGSSTTHLVFSRLFLERRSVELSSRFEVVERLVLFRSAVLLTPYLDQSTIDTSALGWFIAHSYSEAGLDRDQVDTGAVICTGEAAKKQNAEAIIRLFADQGGKFVCAVAGPNLEAALAAHGSGAVARSRDGILMNVDIGGGTCKLAVVKNGAVIETAAINVGSRLVAWDSRGLVSRIEEAGHKVARSAGVPLELGKPLGQPERVAMAEAMCGCLFEFLEGRAASPLTRELLITPVSICAADAARILFSGGVSEYVYGREVRDFGDLGPLLAESVLKRVPLLRPRLEESAEGLRATVIGASQNTIQVSSSTVFLSRNDLLPIRDLLVVTPVLGKEKRSADAVSGAIESAFARFDLLDHQRPVALFIRFPWETSYEALKTVGLGVLQTSALWGNQNPLVLVFDTDIARVVGALLKEELGLQQEVVAIDEIAVGDFDFIDIGKEFDRSQAVPVVVKSLVFR